MTQYRRTDETVLVREVLRSLGARPGIRLFRNSVGLVRLPGGGAIPYGLCPGSSDLVGWRTIQVGSTPIAQFVAIEVKAPAGRLTEEQARFLAAVRAAGGLAAEVRSVEVAEALLSPSSPEASG